MNKCMPRTPMSRRTPAAPYHIYVSYKVDGIEYESRYYTEDLGLHYKYGQKSVFTVMKTNQLKF